MFFSPAWALTPARRKVVQEKLGDFSVLVSKVYGVVRFCMDFCMVNAVQKRDACPVPRFDKLLDQLNAAHLYICI